MTWSRCCSVSWIMTWSRCCSVSWIPPRSCKCRFWSLGLELRPHHLAIPGFSLGMRHLADTRLFSPVALFRGWCVGGAKDFVVVAFYDVSNILHTAALQLTLMLFPLRVLCDVWPGGNCLLIKCQIIPAIDSQALSGRSYSTLYIKPLIEIT